MDHRTLLNLVEIKYISTHYAIDSMEYSMRVVNHISKIDTSSLYRRDRYTVISNDSATSFSAAMPISSLVQFWRTLSL